MEHKPEYADNDQTIFRKPKDRDHPYVVISKTVFEDTEITWKAKGMMGYLLSRPDDWTIILGDLVKRSPEGRGAVRSILRELEQHGYLLKRTLRDRHGRWAGVEMIVLENPAPPEQRTYREKATKATKPETAQPHAENPSTVEPHADECPLLSTDVLPSTDLTKEEPPAPDSPVEDSPADGILTLVGPEQQTATSKEEVYDSGAVVIAASPMPSGSQQENLWDEKVAALGEEDPEIAETEAMFKAPAPSKPRTAEQVKAGVRKAIETFARDGGRPGVADPSSADEWANGPLDAFCALVHRCTLKEKEREHWPKELARWAKDWKATPQETVQAIQAITQSELDWQTYKTPFSDSFKETMDMMIDRLRNDLPINAKGKRNGGSSTPRQKQTAISDDMVVL